MSEIPYGYCKCGCGNKTSISNYNDKRDGIVKGGPVNFIRGHNARRDAKARFFEKVDKTDYCWNWTAYKNHKGYGEMGINSKLILAHRFSWILHNGPIPEGPGYHGTCVLHKCDNAGCVNPSHLFLGTNQDNVDDMMSKGRAALGSKNGRSKLTDEMVEYARENAGKIPQSVIAKHLNVDQSTISKIVNRIWWRHI